MENPSRYLVVVALMACHNLESADEFRSTISEESDGQSVRKPALAPAPVRLRATLLPPGSAFTLFPPAVTVENKPSTGQTPGQAGVGEFELPGGTFWTSIRAYNEDGYNSDGFWTDLVACDISYEMQTASQFIGFEQKMEVKSVSAQPNAYLREVVFEIAPHPEKTGSAHDPRIKQVVCYAIQNHTPVDLTVAGISCVLNALVEVKTDAPKRTPTCFIDAKQLRYVQLFDNKEYVLPSMRAPVPAPRPVDSYSSPQPKRNLFPRYPSAPG